MLSKISLALSQLPLGLTRLECTVDSLEIGDSKFPKTLKALEINFDGGEKPMHLFNLLPIEIEKLYVPISSDDIELEDWTALSRLKHLKSLTLQVSGSFGVKQSELIPRSVEKLSIQNFEGDVNEMNAAWCIEILRALPKNLRELKGVWGTHDFGFISTEIAQNMPRTLEIGDWCEVAPGAVAHLPDSLKEMGLGSGDFNVINVWPSKLHHLYLPRLPDLLLDKLPATLKRLTVEWIELSVGMTERLPRSLSSLCVQAFNPSADLELLLKALPRSLTLLEAMPKGYGSAQAAPVPAPSSSSLSLSLKRLGFP